MSRLVFGHDQTVCEWASKKLDGSMFYGVMAGIGLVDKEGTLIGAAILHHWTANDVEFSVVGTVSRDLLRATAWVAFSRVGRLTVRVPRGKKVILAAAVKYGFKYEGCVRRLYGNFKRHDGMIFGMLREESGKYFKGTNNVSAKAA